MATKRKMIHFGFMMTRREGVALKSAARKRGVAVATVLRRLALAHFKVKADPREVRGPGSGGAGV